jgi:drug/metabolite transporter (DMT)-like permease
MHPAARTRRIIGADELLFLLLWSSGYIGSKIGLPLSGTFTLLFFRYVIAVLLVGAYVSMRSEWHWPDQRSLLIGFLGHFLWLVAVLKALEFGISAGSAALIAAMQPVLTALIAPYLLAERNHLYQWLGVLAGFVGVAVFVWGDAKFSGTPLVIYLLPSIATISLTAITIIERRGAACMAPMLPIMTSLFWQLLVTLICLAPLAYWVEGFAADWTLPFVFSIVWLGVVVSILSFFLMLHLIRTRNAARVSSLQYFAPPVTMLIAWPVFGEALGFFGFMGLFITAGGFFLIHRGEQTLAQQNG